MTWHEAQADAEDAARIREEYQEIANHLGDAAPDINAEVSVSITVDNEIHFMTSGAMFALAPSGVAVVYRPCADGAEDVTHWRDGEEIRHIFIPPANVSN